MDEFRNMINLTSIIIQNKALLRQDFIGHVFHKITGDIAIRKGYATFYTKTPVATLLSHLSLETPNSAWKNKLDESEKKQLCIKNNPCDHAVHVT